MALPDTVAAIARGLAAGDFSSREITEHCLKRIAEVDKTLQAFSVLCTDKARADADAADTRRKRGTSIGPLDGVPYCAKDLYDTAGVETTSSSKTLKGNVPAQDASTVAWLRRAGSVLLGKTYTHEFACGAATPPTRNPWNLAHVPGGSSGGTGAAVAAGEVPWGLGTDSGGSIRIPSCWNGLSGLKPTFGRVPKDGVAVLSWSTDHTGPLCHTAEDVAMAMNVLAGYTGRDPNSARKPSEDYTRNLDQPITGLKIGMPVNYFPSHMPAVSTAVADAINQLKRLGTDVREVTMPPRLDLAKYAAFALWMAEAAAAHSLRFFRHKGDYQPDVRDLISTGHLILATDYINMQRYRQKVNSDIRRVWDESGIDVLVTPTAPATAFRPGQAEYRAPDGWSEGVLAAAVHNTSPFNLTGQPALTVPCGFDENNLPIGLQIVGRPWAEGLVIRVGHAYQQGTDWHTKRPAVAAAAR